MKTLFTLTEVLTAVIILCVTFCGCDKLKKPTSDSTPPTLRWSVIMPDNSTTEIKESGKTIKVKTGSELKVTLVAEDPDGGVKQITLGGASVSSCVSGSLGQTATADFVTDVQNLAPDAGGYVLPSIFLIKNVKMVFDCNPGYTFKGATVTLNGSAENYYSGKVTSTLNIATE